jgi:hypothetical protein
MERRLFVARSRAFPQPGSVIRPAFQVSDARVMAQFVSPRPQRFDVHQDFRLLALRRFRVVDWFHAALSSKVTPATPMQPDFASPYRDDPPAR